MKIKIIETGEIIDLSITNKSGINYISDFIGNTGALNDGQFIFDAEADLWTCSAETADWWVKVVDDNQALNDRITEMQERFGVDAVHNAVAYISVDLDYHAAAANSALDELGSAE